MRITDIHYSSKFVRSLKKIPPELKREIQKREVIFKNNCFDKKLKTHKLTGKLSGLWSFSLTYKHRVLFEFIDRNSVGFIDVGDHSIYE